MSSLRIGVLGPVTAAVNGRPVALGGPRQRAVLAALVAARGRLVDQDALIEQAWERQRLPSATTLHSYVAALRRALEPRRAARGSAEVLVREGTGYALRLAPERVDAERFTLLAGRGERLLSADDPEAAAGVLAEALALWRGAAYAEFAASAFAMPEAARLEGLRLSAQEDLYSAELARGRHTAVVADLGKHTAEQPLSERGWELLALALYRSGRQADALETLRTARRLLAEELGIDPGPSLRRLESALLTQDESVAPPPPRAAALPHPATTAFPPPRAAAAPPYPASPPPRRGRNLPIPLTAMIGREDARDRLAALLDEHRLVTLTGPGGIGKSRLMVEAARARTDEDGPWLVELADLEGADTPLLVARIADVLGIRDAVSAERLAEVLGERRLLLVLDNCEHVLAPAAECATRLLSRCAGVRVLATSREPLGVSGELVWPVDPLPAAAAVELFVARASAALAGWTPSDAERVVAERICRELDGLPLAIELAAVQCRTLSLEQIEEALHDRFAVLVGGPATGPARHRALESAVECSHRLLDERERAVFHRLSVFAGGLDLDAAAAVCGGPVLAEVTALVRKSLLAVEPGTHPRRYRMLETLKEFARRQGEPSLLAAAQAAHRAWVLGRAESAETQILGGQAGAATERTVRDQPEIRAAFTSALLAGESSYALRLGGALTRFWYRWGHVTEGLGWLRAALEMSGPQAPARARARASIGVAALSYLVGDFGTAAEAAAEAVELARRAGDATVEAQALGYRALFGALGGAAGALADAQGAVELAQAVGPPWVRAEALMLLGMLLRFGGEEERARAVLTESIEVARGCGFGFVMSSSAWLVMKSDLDAGRTEQALCAGLDILRVLEEDRDTTAWLVIAHTTAAALARSGQPAQGAALLGVVARRGERIGFTPTALDPVDGPRYAELVRGALPEGDFAYHVERGRRLSAAEAAELLAGVRTCCSDSAGR
ncbi:BTAD domain-containing putative transcriptional regulator [Kitasatospora sp. NPDC059673]|uniref:AfsR/SARP family transcriptional regulator n=1 Tax=Kitasatospora sp. NPDC059673 TaxID=3346901 RepID=UPI0036A0E0CA